MKVFRSVIKIGLLVLTIAFVLASCSGSSLEGRWETEKYGMVESYIEFRSDGTFVYGSGPQGRGDGGTDTYTIDNDGTLHFLGNNYKKTTVEEFRKMDSSQASEYYAFDGSFAYFGSKEREFKRK